jgi:hypothetical protein
MELVEKGDFYILECLAEREDLSVDVIKKMIEKGYF